MKRNLLFLFVFATVSFGAIAQRTVTNERVMKNGVIRTDVFTPQTFIQVGAGGLVYWGENDSHRSLQYRVTPAIDAGIGHYFTPSVGARLMYGGLAARGTGLGKTPYVSGLPWVEGTNWYKEQFDLNYVHADFMWNLSNTFGGFRADRAWEFVPYIGIGYAFAKADDSSNEKTNSLAPTAGLLNKIRLSPRFDLNLDARFVFVKEEFDGVKGGKGSLEYFTTASLGFSYYFKKRNAPQFTEVVFDTSALDNQISALQRDLEAARARAAQLERDLAAANNRPAREVVKTDFVLPELAIFFPLDRATLDEKEKINLGFIAEAMKKTPDKTYTLFGSADKQTGSPVYNQGLSERRAQAVMDELIKLGVNRNQLRLDPQGDKEQRFGSQILNRVVVVENK